MRRARPVQLWRRYSASLSSAGAGCVEVEARLLSDLANENSGTSRRGVARHDDLPPAAIHGECSGGQRTMDGRARSTPSSLASRTHSGCQWPSGAALRGRQRPASVRIRRARPRARGGGTDRGPMMVRADIGSIARHGRQPHTSGRCAWASDQPQVHVGQFQALPHSGPRLLGRCWQEAEAARDSGNSQARLL